MILKWQVKLLILFVSFVLIDSYQGQCGVSLANKGLIAGGTVSERGKWPWVAALFYSRTRKFFCGSSLISARHLLTAAHCVQVKGSKLPISPASRVIAYFGRHNLRARFERDSFALIAVDISVHPDWKSDWNSIPTDFDADIAVIKLFEDVTKISTIVPVCLWTGDAKVESEGTVVGWGKNETQKNDEHSDVLREVTLRPVSLIDCMRHSGPSRLVSNRTFCAGGDRSTPCSGDSGGGYFVIIKSKTFLMGIVSSAEVVLVGDALDDYCDTYSPAVFTDVGKFTEWIESAANLTIAKNEKFSQKKCTNRVQRTRRAFGAFEPRSWPWLARLFKKTSTNETFFCGGSLISQRHVLTAAHCIQYKRQSEPDDPNSLVVYLGHQLRNPINNRRAVRGVRAEPKTLIIHPDWDPESDIWDADIAIFEFTTDVHLNDEVFPVCLFTAQRDISDFYEGTFVGWGMTDYGDGRLPDYPLQLKIKFVSSYDCDDIEDIAAVLSSRAFCAGGGGSGVCNGDSGSGLYIMSGSDWYLTGIASVGGTNIFQECDVEKPAVFTNVAKFSQWIEETLGSYF